MSVWLARLLAGCQCIPALVCLCLSPCLCTFLCVCVCLRLRVYVRFFVILVPDAYASHPGAGQPSELIADHFVLAAEAAQICIAPNLGYL